MSIFVLGDFYYGYDEISEDIINLSRYIKENNFSVILNLEGAITSNRTEVKKRGDHLRQSKKVIEVLKLLNVKGVTLANNHIYDFMAEGLKETIRILDENGIQHSGAGLTKEEAYKPIQIIDDGIKYCFYSMTDSYEEAICIDNKHNSGCAKITLDITKAFDIDAKNYVILHTGFEYNTLPMPRNIKQNHQFIDLGAEGVICMHPHLTQQIVKYNDKNIAYSLGNFYFSTYQGEFEHRKIKNKPEGFCNLGLGIIIKKGIVDIAKIEHNKISIVSNNVYTNEDSDYKKFSIKYIIICLKNRNNHNPILLGNNIIDKFMIFILNTEYKVYRCIKKFIKKF